MQPLIPARVISEDVIPALELVEPVKVSGVFVSSRPGLY